MSTSGTEADCQHQMYTYKSTIVGGFRKRFRKCHKCEYHDTKLVPMEYSYKKPTSNTNVGIESVDSSANAPTLE